MKTAIKLSHQQSVQQRADNAENRAQLLAERLLALGVDPESL